MLALAVGIDTGYIDLVTLIGAEIQQLVRVLCSRPGNVVEDETVRALVTREFVPAQAADEDVVAIKAEQVIGPRAAVQKVVSAVAPELIVAITAQKVVIF